jgi:hypothetical protein
MVHYIAEEHDTFLEILIFALEKERILSSDGPFL